MLRRAGYEFETLSAGVPERAGSHLSLRELTTANATRKALAVARKKPRAVILAADTLVALDGEVIGKPQNLEAARAILRRLSGRTHEVCTAVLIAEPRGRFASFAEFSRVTFWPLNSSDIDAYLREIDPLDKAGAYAAQEPGEGIIASIKGSVTNVVGLPLERTMAELKSFGVFPGISRGYRVSNTTGLAASGAGTGSRRSTRYKNQTMKQFTSNTTTAPMLG